MSARWNDYHGDPRMSYYRLLRNDYHQSAAQAHAALKRMDALVVGISVSSAPRAHARDLLQVGRRLLEILSQRLWPGAIDTKALLRPPA